MGYSMLGPFIDGGAPYLSAATFNHLEAGIAAAASGPTILDAASSGVTASGADVSAAFAALLASIGSYTIVRLPSGTINIGAASPTIDASLISLAGDRTSLAGTGTITITSSVGYSTRQKNWGAVLRGVTLTGPNLTIGSGTATTVGMFRLIDGGMIGGTLTFAANAWKVGFDAFHIQGTTVTAPAGTVNTGENMTWRDSMLTDSATLALGVGDWHFDGCSFDNMTVTINGGAVVHMDGPHFEANGGSSARLISVSSGSACTITGGILVIDAGTGNWTEAPFYVDPAVVRGGLTIRGMQIPLQSYYKPETTDLIRVLVAGGGRALFEDIFTYESSGAVGFALGETANLIRNGGCEENASTGWTIANNGTYSADSAVKNRGAYSHKLTCTSGQSLQFSQNINVTPGRLLWVQAWIKFVAAGGSSVSAQLYFFDRAGTQISTTDYQQWTSSTTAYWAAIREVPAGTAYAQVYFYTPGGSSGTSTVNIDDVIANLA